MMMLGDIMSELNIQKLRVVAGTDVTKPPQPLPLSIERMDKLERLTLVDFQNVRFDKNQAEHLATTVPTSVTLSLCACTLPLDDSNDNIFLKSILSLRKEPINLKFYKNLPVVGDEDVRSNLEAGLRLLTVLAREGLISSLLLESEPMGYVYSYQELVAYKELHDVLGDSLHKPDNLRADQQGKHPRRLVKYYHDNALPPWQPALTAKGKPCLKCKTKYCSAHKSKADQILADLGIDEGVSTNMIMCIFSSLATPKYS